MDEFFERRLDGYDEHILTGIEGVRSAGFLCVEVLQNWGATYTLRALRSAIERWG